MSLSIPNPLHEKAYRQTSLHLGRDLTQEEVASLKGTVDEIGVAKLLEYNPGATLSVPQVMEYYNNVFKAMFDQMRLIPGSREFIQKAHLGKNEIVAALVREGFDKAEASRAYEAIVDILEGGVTGRTGAFLRGIGVLRSLWRGIKEPV